MRLKLGVYIKIHGLAEWLERYAGKHGVAGSIPNGGIYFNFEFCLLPFALSSVKTIQMRSSMTFIKSNGFKEIDLILKI